MLVWDVQEEKVCLIFDINILPFITYMHARLNIGATYTYGTAQFELDIYTHVTLELFDKIVKLLASFT